MNRIPRSSRYLNCLTIILSSLALLTVTSSLRAEEEIKQEWQPSTLSDKTLAKVNSGVEAYQKCLNTETVAHVNDKEDSRKVTDLILRNCEPSLTVVKEAFNAEKVPSAISDRYIRSKRSRGAQQVVRVVMGAQAMRYSETHP